MSSYKRKRLKTNIRKKRKWILGFKGVRYLFSGGTATAVDIGSYYLALKNIFTEDTYSLWSISAGSPILALCFSYSCGFLTSFTLSKYFVFKGSEGKTRYQLLRFLMVVFITFLMNYGLMRILVYKLELIPIVARIISAALVAICSFFMHNIFTFKVKGK